MTCGCGHRDAPRHHGSNAELWGMFLAGFVGAAGAFVFYITTKKLSDRYPELVPEPPMVSGSRRAVATGPTGDAVAPYLRSLGFTEEEIRAAEERGRAQDHVWTTPYLGSQILRSRAIAPGASR